MKTKERKIKALLSYSRSIEQCKVLDHMVNSKMFDMDMNWSTMFPDSPSLN